MENWSCYYSSMGNWERLYYVVVDALERVWLRRRRRRTLMGSRHRAIRSGGDHGGARGAPLGRVLLPATHRLEISLAGSNPRDCKCWYSSHRQRHHSKGLPRLPSKYKALPQRVQWDRVNSDSDSSTYRLHSKSKSFLLWTTPWVAKVGAVPRTSDVANSRVLPIGHRLRNYFLPSKCRARRCSRMTS